MHKNKFWKTDILLSDKNKTFSKEIDHQISNEKTMKKLSDLFRKLLQDRLMLLGSHQLKMKKIEEPNVKMRGSQNVLTSTEIDRLSQIYKIICENIIKDTANKI